VQTRAGSVHFGEQGSGPPVLLLHATLHDRRDFDPIIPALARDHRVIAVDWPAHGESPAPRSPLQPSAMLFADVLEDVVQAMDLPPAVLIGNSVGGFAAARLAITHPDRVASLVLIDTGGFVRTNPLIRGVCRLLGTPAFARVALPRTIPSYMKAKTQNDREIQARAIARAKTPEGIATAAALWRSFAAEEHDLRPRAGELSAPTLIVWGAKDTVAFLRVGRETHAALPGSRLEVLDTGHVVFSSEPEAFLSLVEPFIEDASHRAATQAST
jgi:pimeloyl-ACP methyl ester carboxylesterase